MKENEQKIRDFIRNNNLKFTVGRRNSDSTILAGYALHLGYDNSDENTLLTIIRSECKGVKPEEEFGKVLDFAYENHYEKFWTTSRAKKQYKF